MASIPLRDRNETEATNKIFTALANRTKQLEGQP
jgi:hypothetical protein